MNTEIKNLSILLVDDEKKFLDSIAARIRLRGIEPLTASSGLEALEIARKNKVHAAVVDLKMPHMDGMVTITKLKEIDPEIKTVLLTGFGDEKVREAAEALDSVYVEKDKMGEFWNFIKQFSPEDGMIIIKPPYGQEGVPAGLNGGIKDSDHRLLETEEIEMYAASQALQRRPHLTEADSWKSFFDSRRHRLVGATPSMLSVKKDIYKVASLDCTVLIQGETGTGKELVARAIHNLSSRKENKFMAINCGSFSEELLTNELFGHEKEAFTGALNRKIGLFEAATGGTILLDEIGDTPLAMQVKLLRVLQEKKIIRMGGTEEIPVDVRVLAATNQSLKKKIDKGDFRQDLYYRLNAFIIRIPPLRERREDIPLLSSYFLDKYRKEFGKDIKGIAEEVLILFMKYPFPGNVRELENAIERAVIVCEESEIKKDHLPQQFKEIKGPFSTKREGLMTLAEIEKQYILEVLSATKGNKSEAARILNINRASLWRKLKQFEDEDGAYS
jgi:DNA-binding NtrC family response regulator